MRTFTALALVAAALATCTSGSAGTSSTTSLKVTFWENGSSAADPAAWTLRCNPARGTVPAPAAACRRLAAGGTRLFAPISPRVACTELYGGPETARIVGTVAGKRVWASFNRTNGCQIGRWNRLSPWLLPTGGVR